MIYSSNVSEKKQWHSRNISYPLLLCETFEEYIIPLGFVRDIRGVYHNPCFCVRHSKNIPFPLFVSAIFMIYSSNVSDNNKGYDIFLECLRQKQGLWYTPRMSQTQTSGMIYSSNISDKNKGYVIRSISCPLFLSETFEECTITLIFL
jgi:hypothetical protein